MQWTGGVRGSGPACSGGGCTQSVWEREGDNFVSDKAAQEEEIRPLETHLMPVPASVIWMSPRFMISTLPMESRCSSSPATMYDQIWNV